MEVIKFTSKSRKKQVNCELKFRVENVKQMIITFSHFLISLYGPNRTISQRFNHSQIHNYSKGPIALKNLDIRVGALAA